MAKLTADQKTQRAATRRRNEAISAEAEHERTAAKHREWEESGTRLTKTELEEGVPCRGCGLPILDGLGDRPPLLKLTDKQRLEHLDPELRPAVANRVAARVTERWPISLG